MQKAGKSRFLNDSKTEKVNDTNDLSTKELADQIYI